MRNLEKMDVLLKGVKEIEEITKGFIAGRRSDDEAHFTVGMIAGTVWRIISDFKKLEEEEE